MHVSMIRNIYVYITYSVESEHCIKCVHNHINFPYIFIKS